MTPIRVMPPKVALSDARGQITREWYLFLLRAFERGEDSAIRVEALETGVTKSAIVACNFGATFTDKAQTVVTGQTWVKATSCITAQVLTGSGVDPDEIRLLDLRPVVSDLVAGVGFTLTLYSEPEAAGSYLVMCVGV